MKQHYKITFSGTILFGFESEKVKADIQQLLKLNPQQVADFFSGKQVVLKKNLPFDEAQRIKSALENKGLLVNIAEEEVELSLATEIVPPAQTPSKGTDGGQNPANAVSSYYAPPNAPLSSMHSDASKMTANFSGSEEEAPDFFKFSFEGRYGRLNYLNGWWAINGVALLIGGVFGLLAAVVSPSLLYLLIILIPFSLFFGIRMAALRFHDLNKNGWYSLLFLLGLIPYVGGLINLGLSLYLIFAKGTEGDNDYGVQPKKGGIIGLVLTCISPVFFIAILSAFALPAYQDYTNRTYVAEGIALAMAPKMAVAEYYTDKKVWPSSNSDVGLPVAERISGTAVESIGVTNGGNIVIQYNHKLKRGTVVLVPTVSGGQYIWDCKGGTVLPKHRPAICRR